jgi:hypothetical protein
LGGSYPSGKSLQQGRKRGPGLIGLVLGMEILEWPPENIEKMAKKLEQELLG